MLYIGLLDSGRMGKNLGVIMGWRTSWRRIIARTFFCDLYADMSLFRKRSTTGSNYPTSLNTSEQTKTQMHDDRRTS